MKLHMTRIASRCSLFYQQKIGCYPIALHDFELHWPTISLLINEKHSSLFYPRGILTLVNSGALRAALSLSYFIVVKCTGIEPASTIVTHRWLLPLYATINRTPYVRMRGQPRTLSHCLRLQEAGPHLTTLFHLYPLFQYGHLLPNNLCIVPCAGCFASQYTGACHHYPSIGCRRDSNQRRRATTFHQNPVWKCGHCQTIIAIHPCDHPFKWHFLCEHYQL